MFRRMLIGLLTLCFVVPALHATSFELYQAWHFFHREVASRIPGVQHALEFFFGDYASPPPMAVEPVVTSTGEYFTSQVDLAARGPLELGFARHHGGFVGQAASFWGFYATTASPMGANWVHNHQYLLMRIGNRDVAVYYARGKVVFFHKSGGAWQMDAAPVGFVYMGTPYQMVETGSKLEMMDPASLQVLTFEFAALGNGQVTGVEGVRDRNGNAHTYAYNADGTLARVDDLFGRSLVFAYVDAGGSKRISSVTDQAGRTVGYSYTATGRLRDVTSPRGTLTKYTYDGSSRVTTLTRPEGNVPITNTYSATGKCTSQTDGEGNLWTLAYGAGSTTITDPLGHARVHEFDGELRLVRWTDEAGRSVEMDYDGSHRLIATTDRLGATSAMGYHAASGLVSSRTDAAGSTWTQTYIAQPQEGFTFHELERVDFPDGTAATFARDAKGNVVAHADRAGQSFTYTHDAHGQVLTATNPKGGVQQFTYDAAGNVATSTNPAGDLTSYTYDGASRVTAITRPDGSVATFAYDADDHLVASTDENGNARSFTWDLNGNLASASDPLGNTTTWDYDGNDDLVLITDPAGKSVQLAYDERRQRIRRTDREGGVTQWSYDARRRLASAIDPAGGVSSFTYDDEGVLASLTNAAGETTTLTSDVLGRTLRITDPLGHVSESTYDALGRRTSSLDGKGERTEIAFDAEGLLAQVRMPEPGVGGRYAHDELDGLTRVRDPRGNAWRSQRDDLGRIRRQVDPLGNATDYAHDDRGRVERMTFPGGLGTVDVTWDAAGRPMRQLFSDGTDITASFDAADRLTSASGLALAYDGNDRVTTCNGIGMTYDADRRLATVTLAQGRTVTYGYDDRGLLTSVTDWVGGTTRLVHDASGRLTAVKRPNGITTRQVYDAAGRLVSLREGALARIDFTRDEVGHVTGMERHLPLAATPSLESRDFTFDAACQVEASEYDALGRVTNDGARALAWDLASRLREIDDGSGPITYTYDALGNIVSRTQGGTTTQLVWNVALGLPSLAIERAGGGDRRYLVHTPDGMLLHTIDAASGGRRFFHYDQVGSTQFLTDDGGAVTDAYAYTPYGELVARTGTTDNAFLWQGKSGAMTDAGLCWMRARWYDPDSMRFLTRDPIRGTDPVRINPYQALFGDPLVYTDPTGRDITHADAEVILMMFGSPDAHVPATSDFTPRISYMDAIGILALFGDGEGIAMLGGLTREDDPDSFDDDMGNAGSDRAALSTYFSSPYYLTSRDMRASESLDLAAYLNSVGRSGAPSGSPAAPGYIYTPLLGSAAAPASYVLPGSQRQAGFHPLPADVDYGPGYFNDHDDSGDY